MGQSSTRAKEGTGDIHCRAAWTTLEASFSACEGEKDKGVVVELRVREERGGGGGTDLEQRRDSSRLLGSLSVTSHKDEHGVQLI